MKLQTLVLVPDVGFLSSCAELGSGRIPQTATRESFGIVSLSNSNRLPANAANRVNPVMFPPGRARLVNEPAANRIAGTCENDGDRLCSVLGS